MTRTTEQHAVQTPLIRYANEAGWEIEPPAEAVKLRRGEAGTLFYSILEETLLRLNSGIVTPDNVTEIVRRIEGVRNSIEGNAEILAWLRGERSIYVEAEKRQRNVRLIDYESPGANLFQVTAEWQYTNGRMANRADVMFLINGLPVALVETKSAKLPDGIEKAMAQIRRYHLETPEMLTAPQVFNLTHLIGFYYGATWSLDRKGLFNWKDEQSGDFEHKVKAFFDRPRFLTLLKEWILFYVKDDELRKTVLRQHQTRAVEKVLSRCLKSKKRTGLVWHTQGSGKTFTMITTARLLLANKEGGKPTVLLIVDRNELEGQLTGWVDRLMGELAGEDIAIERATSKYRLRELLASDFRGLIVTMIHKFDGIPKAINTRDNIFVLIDEAHRSTGGDLGNYLMGALPKATLIGFTGTPIDKTAYGQGTFKTFGKDDTGGYLDKYSIAESMEDGTTLRLKYALAPNEIRLPEAILEKEFLDLAEAEGVSDVDDLNRILDKAVTLKAFLKSDDRIKAVAAFVADHFTRNVQPLGYKAFLVAVDREACALYKQALDKLLPPESVTAVYTAAQNDSARVPIVAANQISETDEKAARKTFIKPGLNPRIMIVTDKLLTGYDAPILYCMYLDKPMRDHVLLQAIARVNRPYEADAANKKPCGLVVDFIGVFGKLKKALAFDSREVSGVIENIDVLFDRFKALMNGKARTYLPLAQGDMDDKAIERAIDTFADKRDREEFYSIFKEIETLYEILSPSPDLRDFIDPFARLATLDRIMRNAFETKPVLYTDVARKTEQLVRENATAYGFKKISKVVEINESSLKAIQEKEGSDNGKVISLVKALVQAAEEHGKEEPYLIPIGERAQAIMEAFDERQASARESVVKLDRLWQEKIEAERERRSSDMDTNTFTIYWELKSNSIRNAAELAVAINAVMERFPDFQFHGGDLRPLKAELYKLLLTVVDTKAMVPLVERLIKLERK